MPNEISLSAVLNAAKGGAVVTSSQNKVLDMTGEDMISATQLIGESAAEALVLGDLASCGQLLVKNMDDTNYVELALDDALAHKFAKIRPGCFAFLQPASTTLYAKANTAPCRVQVTALEV